MMNNDGVYIRQFPTMKPLDKPESAKRAAAGTNCAVPAAVISIEIHTIYCGSEKGGFYFTPALPHLPKIPKRMG